MAITNNNKKFIDIPFWELLSQTPTASQAISCMTMSEDSNSRYLYYLSGTSFYRYDTQGDTWQQLATPSTAAVTFAEMRHTKRRGFHGRVLAATSTSVTIPGLKQTLDGSTLEILQGTGAGQNRTLTWASDTVYDSGVITGTTTSTLVDSTKKWKPNQYAGYMVGITFGTDATQYKKILYNDANTLYIADVNLQPHDPWNNQIYVAATPYALPVTTAGLQAMYEISASTYNVSAWTTTPDMTSFFTTATGGIYLLSSAAAAPFLTLQYYDIAHDSWQTKTVPQSLLLAAYGTDATMERTSKIGTALVTNLGTVSGTTRTITDAGISLTPDRYNNHRIFITGGTGIGQSRRIVAHTATTFTVSRNWDVTPTTGSTYEIWPDYDKLYVAGGAASSMYAYSIETDNWMQGQNFDEGITNNISATMSGWKPVGVTSGTYIALGVQVLNPTPVAGGTSGFVIGDVLTLVNGTGTGAQAIVTGITSTGVITSVELSHSGTGTGYAASNTTSVTGGTGTGTVTLAITTVGPTALITTASAHWFKTGQSVTFAGCTEGAWNASYTIIGVPTTAIPTTFCVATTATATMVATASQGTTTIVDPTKNWVVNEHVGRIIHVMVAGQTPTSQVRWITANTATTITVGLAITAAVNGTSKYIIYDSKIFGVDNQKKPATESGFGRASSGSTTTLVDSTKTWMPGQWVGYVFKVEGGTGYGSGRISITANTSNTLTFATQSFTPDTTTRYEIADTWGLITAATLNTVTEATTKNWVANQWAGKRVKVTGSALVGTEAAVTANAATTLTATIGTPDTSTPYAILSIPVRGAGIDLVWAWNNTDLTKRGRYMYLPRGGGSNTLDIYDITTGKWTYGTFLSPQTEGFTTGSSYAYDGVDTILAARSVASGPLRIFGYDTTKNTFNGIATTSIPQNAVHIGNFLEVVYDPSGTLEYIYTLQNTGTILSRALLF